MTKQAASELGAYNIAVNSVAPGPVNTPMYRSEGQVRSMGIKTFAEQDKALNAAMPLGDSAALEPSDIADSVVFLAGERAKTISGTVIDVALGFNASYTG